MEELIEKLLRKYPERIADIKTVGKAEINIVVIEGTSAEEFSQELQNHLLEIVDELTIVKINIVNSAGTIVHSFATNQ